MKKIKPNSFYGQIINLNEVEFNANPTNDPEIAERLERQTIALKIIDNAYKKLKEEGKLK